MKEYKIYVLKHPITEEIRYIGVTTSKVNLRYSQHLYSKKRLGTPVSKWIYSLSLEELKPSIEVIEICNKENWEEREKFWISNYENLLNIHEGGKGVVINRRYTSIQRSAIGHQKSVCQITDEGKLIKKWNSAKEATLELGLKSNSSILNAIKNVAGCHKVKGTRWCYYEDLRTGNINLHEYKSTVDYLKLKSVFLFDNNGEFIKEYPCLYQLTNELWPETKSYTSALKAIKNKRKCKDYYISYERYFKI